MQSRRIHPRSDTIYRTHIPLHSFKYTVNLVQPICLPACVLEIFGNRETHAGRTCKQNSTQTITRAQDRTPELWRCNTTHSTTKDVLCWQNWFDSFNKNWFSIKLKQVELHANGVDWEAYLQAARKLLKIWSDLGPCFGCLFSLKFVSLSYWAFFLNVQTAAHWN